MALALLASVALSLCASGPRDNCVHDGDTFWLDGEKVRIADIDAPELQARCARERDLALAARNRLLALLNAGPFTLRRSSRDRYGRTLAVVWSAGRSVGGVLVAEGLARQWDGVRRSWC